MVLLQEHMNRSRDGPGVPRASQGGTHPQIRITDVPPQPVSLRQPGVAGSSPSTLSMSLAIPIPSSKSPLRTDPQLPRGQPGAFALAAPLSGRVQSSFSLISEV